jgi:hypothetical protein
MYTNFNHGRNRQYLHPLQIFTRDLIHDRYFSAQIILSSWWSWITHNAWITNIGLRNLVLGPTKVMLWETAARKLSELKYTAALAPDQF